MYLHEDASFFEDLVLQTAESLHRDERYVVKGYFAVAMLREIGMRNSDAVFKEGTCLSKCYNAIDRFSEDIDLGIPFERATEGVRKNMKRAVVESAKTLGLSIPNIGSTRSRREFNRFEIALPRMALGEERLLVETVVMAPASPYEVRLVQSFIGEFASRVGIVTWRSNFSCVRSRSRRTRWSERSSTRCSPFATITWWERLPVVSRGISMICSSFQPLIAFGGDLAALVAMVRGQRKGNFHCPSADDGVSLADTIDAIRKEEPYRKDYERVTAPLLYEDVSYDVASQVLVGIASFLREYGV